MMCYILRTINHLQGVYLMANPQTLDELILDTITKMVDTYDPCSVESWELLAKLEYLLTENRIRNDKKIAEEWLKIEEQDKKIAETNKFIEEQRIKREETRKFIEEQKQKVATDWLKIEAYKKPIQESIISAPIEIEEVKSIQVEAHIQKTMIEELRILLTELLDSVRNLLKNMDNAVNIQMEEEKVEPRRLGFF